MHLRKNILAAAILLSTFTALPASADTNMLHRIIKQGPATAVPQTGKIEVAFSPRGGAQNLVIKTINSAKKTLHVMGYSMTSAPIAQALINARKRGVRVGVVVDHKQNINSRYAVSAMNAMASADILVRTVQSFTAHDKVIISDERHVQTGSYNYSAAAEKSNSENVLVIWDNPQLANAYLNHFSHNWELGVHYQPGY